MWFYSYSNSHLTVYHRLYIVNFTHTFLLVSLTQHFCVRFLFEEFFQFPVFSFMLLMFPNLFCGIIFAFFSLLFLFFPCMFTFIYFLCHHYTSPITYFICSLIHCFVFLYFSSIFIVILLLVYYLGNHSFICLTLNLFCITASLSLIICSFILHIDWPIYVMPFIVILAFIVFFVKLTYSIFRLCVSTVATFISLNTFFLATSGFLHYLPYFLFILCKLQFFLVL